MFVLVAKHKLDYSIQYLLNVLINSRETTKTTGKEKLFFNVFPLLITLIAWEVYV